MCPRGRPRGQGRPRGLHLCHLYSVPYLGFLVFVCVATARAASFLPLF